MGVSIPHLKCCWGPEKFGVFFLYLSYLRMQMRYLGRDPRLNRKFIFTLSTPQTQPEGNFLCDVHTCVLTVACHMKSGGKPVARQH